jgi:hypothetical protein
MRLLINLDLDSREQDIAESPISLASQHSLVIGGENHYRQTNKDVITRTICGTRGSTH